MDGLQAHDALDPQGACEIHKRASVLLVFDNFKEHLKEEVLAKLTESNISYVIIPGGCTSKIQPLDVCLNKPFKTYLRGAWEEYMVNQARRSSDASSIPTASRTEIIQWVVAANDCLNSQGDMIQSHSLYVEFLTTMMVVRITWFEFLQSSSKL